MKVSGKMIRSLVGDLNFYLMEIDMRDIILMENLRDKEHTFGTTEKFMTDNGRMDSKYFY